MFIDYHISHGEEKARTLFWYDSILIRLAATFTVDGWPSCILKRETQI